MRTWLRYLLAIGALLLCLQTYSLLTLRAAQLDAALSVPIPVGVGVSEQEPSGKGKMPALSMRMTVLIFPSDVNGVKRGKRLQAIIDTWGAELREMQQHQLVTRHPPHRLHTRRVA